MIPKVILQNNTRYHHEKYSKKPLIIQRQRDIQSNTPKHNTIMNIIIIATKNPKATCHPHNHQNISPRTPRNIMATSRSKPYSDKCHEQSIHS